jgi:hypothetical protein
MNLSNARWCAGVSFALALSLSIAATEEFPPFKTGGQGGFFSADLPTNAKQKSPSIPLFQRGKKIAAPQSACVILTTDLHDPRSLEVTLDSTLRVRFRHSNYGSQVEEIFALRPDGFELVELRYGEARLVDFYGHEHGRFDNGAWVVKPAPTLIPRLNLQASHDAELSVAFGPRQSQQPIVVQPNSALRLTVEQCNSGADG